MAADWQQVGGLRRAFMENNDEEEFQEDEVWAVMDADNSNSNSSSSSKQKSRKNGNSVRRYTPPRAIPRGGTGQSAPVDVSDWSKILHKNSKTSKAKAKKQPSVSHEDACHDSDDEGECIKHEDDDDDEEDDDGDMVPPHEILARRFAKTQIASYSMCEGAGRTLKGRDLSKLRNAILTKTGFLE